VAQDRSKWCALVSAVIKKLLSSQEGLYFMELISNLYKGRFLEIVLNRKTLRGVVNDRYMKG
jgi:hypothetical protein